MTGVLGRLVSHTQWFGTLPYKGRNSFKFGQCSHPNFKLGVFIPPMYKICGYEVKFTGMTFYLEKVIGRNGHGPI